jgi:hypothetical protein
MSCLYTACLVWRAQCTAICLTVVQPLTQAGVSLTAGLVAGVCAAVISQPADTVLSAMNAAGGSATVGRTFSELVSVL